MSDSDSPLSDPPPPRVPADAYIAQALREVVRQAFKADDFDNLTLKRVRAAVTKQLDLPDGFLKSDPKWGDKSKAIVTEEVATHDVKPNEATSEPVKPQPKSNFPKDSPRQKPPAQSRSAPTKSRKRRSLDSRAARQSPKRRKKSASDSDEEQGGKNNNDSNDLTSELGDEAATPDASKSSASPAPTSPAKKAAASKPLSNNPNDLGPDSELSDVLDDAPTSKPKVKRSSSKEVSASSKQPKKTKAKAKPDKQLTPQNEEIKRLQSQLAKCGIRKLWGKELAKLDSPRDKIAHLKDMLRDAGMDGRFSEEKARQIKEARELRADLEAIQEGDEMWGTKEDAPRRRLAKGLQELQGLVDDDEESD